MWEKYEIDWHSEECFKIFGKFYCGQIIEKVYPKISGFAHCHSLCKKEKKDFTITAIK